MFQFLNAEIGQCETSNRAATQASCIRASSVPGAASAMSKSALAVAVLAVVAVVAAGAGAGDYKFLERVPILVNTVGTGAVCHHRSMMHRSVNSRTGKCACVGCCRIII
jgi:hypothetical protein